MSDNTEERSKKRGRGPNKPKRPKDGRLYPKGVPTDGRGMFDPNGLVDEGMLGKIPLDEASARLTKETNDALRDHAKGVRTRLPADERARYWACVKEHPMARVSIEQVYPQKNQAIPAQPLTVLKSWDELNTYVRERYWNGDQATYHWRVSDNNNHIWTMGTLEYAADPNFVRGEDEMAKNNNGNNGQQPPPGWPPGYGPPGYGGYPGMPMMPPWMPMMLPWMQTQPPQQQPQQPAPAPAPQQPQPPSQMPWPYPMPSADPAAQALADQNKMMFAAFMEMMKQPQPQPQFMPQPQQDPQMMMWMYQMWLNTEEAKKKAEELKAATLEAAKQPAPKTDLENARSHIDMLLGVVKETRRIADALDPDREAREARQEAEASAAKKGDDDFPLAVKEIGIGRYAFDKHTRQPVDATTALLINADKIAEGLEKIFDKAMGAWKERGQLTPEQKQEQAEALRIAAGKTEIATRALAVEEERLRLERLRLTGHVVETSVAPPAPPAPPPPPAPSPAVIEAAPPPPPPPPPPAPVAEPASRVLRVPAAGGARAPVRIGA